MKKQILLMICGIAGIIALNAQAPPTGTTIMPDPPIDAELDAKFVRPGITFTIDGVKDYGYGDLIAFPGFTTQWDDVHPIATDHSGSFNVVWDSSGLYIFISVFDDIINKYEDSDDTVRFWFFDGIEIYTNPYAANDDATDGSYETDAAQNIFLIGDPADSINRATSNKSDVVESGNRNISEDEEWVIVETALGYDFELFLPFDSCILPIHDPTLATLESSFGFTINIVDSDEGPGNPINSAREDIMMWAGAEQTQRQHLSTHYFGTLNLINDFTPTSITRTQISKLNVYPNPSNGLVNVENAKSTINVYNVLGKKVLSQEANSPIVHVNVKDLTPGMYIFRSGKSMRKVMVE